MDVKLLIHGDDKTPNAVLMNLLKPCLSNLREPYIVFS